MDIRNWPDDRIMQLPDSAFGRRWAILFGAQQLSPASKYYLSECALPDKCVLWELWAFSAMYFEPTESLFRGGGQFELALADFNANNTTAFRQCENMFPCSDEDNHQLRWNLHLTRLKTLYHAQGRRVMLRVTWPEGGYQGFEIGLVFSSIPTEVPDCLFSA